MITQFNSVYALYSLSITYMDTANSLFDGENIPIYFHYSPAVLLHMWVFCGIYLLHFTFMVTSIVSSLQDPSMSNTYSGATLSFTPLKSCPYGTYPKGNECWRPIGRIDNNNTGNISHHKYILCENAKKIVFTLLDLSVSSLRRGHANLLCIVPIFSDGTPKRPTYLYRYLWGVGLSLNRYHRGDTKLSIRINTTYIRNMAI